MASVLAILLASGGHWMILQSVAWTRMFLDFSRTDTLAEAVSKTFDGKHPCRMCHQIREGHEQERQEPSLVDIDRLPPMSLALVAVPANAFSPLISRIVLHGRSLETVFVLTPPEPPPRAV